MAVGLAQVGANPAPRVSHAQPDLQREFLARVASPTAFDVLFEHLPDIWFFVKDSDGRFIRASHAFVLLVGAEDEAAVIGARDADLFPRDLAEGYARDDLHVMSRGQAIVDKAELYRRLDGRFGWCCTTKLPLLDALGRPIGVCGISRDVKRMDAGNATLLFWAPVVEVMLNDYANALEMSDLAQRVGLSVSQFNRAFRKRFHTTPFAYLSNIRLNAARHLLVTSDLSMAQIALQTGFYDQSHLTNRFVKQHGLPPSQYRATHARPTAERARVSSKRMSDNYMSEGGAQP